MQVHDFIYISADKICCDWCFMSLISNMKAIPERQFLRYLRQNNIMLKGLSLSVKFLKLQIKLKRGITTIIIGCST